MEFGQLFWAYGAGKIVLQRKCVMPDRRGVGAKRSPNDRLREEPRSTITDFEKTTRR
jgi:hypothetical protein